MCTLASTDCGAVSSLGSHLAGCAHALSSSFPRGTGNSSSLEIWFEFFPSWLTPDFSPLEKSSSHSYTENQAVGDQRVLQHGAEGDR